MAFSSLLYLGCAYTWLRFGFVVLSSCFCLVSLLSVGADAGGNVLSERTMRPLRMADRTIGTIALLSAVGCNCTSPLNAVLAILAMLSSVAFLAKGRRVARDNPHARRAYLAWHATWHAYGAAALVAVTCRAQTRP